MLPKYRIEIPHLHWKKNVTSKTNQNDKNVSPIFDKSLFLKRSTQTMVCLDHLVIILSILNIIDLLR